MIKEKAIETLKIEAAAVENLIARIDEDFVAAFEAAVNGIKMRGKAVEGEKTMLGAKTGVPH